MSPQIKVQCMHRHATLHTPLQMDRKEASKWAHDKQIHHDTHTSRQRWTVALGAPLKFFSGLRYSPKSAAMRGPNPKNRPHGTCAHTNARERNKAKSAQIAVGDA
jgi:hypothetical protein